jgi:hypothetical protein
MSASVSPRVLGVGAGGALVAGLASLALAVHMARTPPPRPAAPVRAVVEPGDTVDVPVGPPARIAWLDLAVLEQGKDNRPAQQRVARRTLGTGPLELRTDEGLVEVNNPTLEQLYHFEYESTRADRFEALGLRDVGVAPGRLGVYVDQIALRAGDVVTLDPGEPIGIWRGDPASVEARARGVASSSVGFAFMAASVSVVCFPLAYALLAARRAALAARSTAS